MNKRTFTLITLLALLLATGTAAVVRGQALPADQ
jgi:hypothetical protein